jgi:hypothetical protein
MSKAMHAMSSSRRRNCVSRSFGTRPGSVQASVSARLQAWTDPRLRGDDGENVEARIDAYKAKHAREAAE